MQPENLRYPGQQSDETTLRVYYKHWMMIMPFIFSMAILALVCLAGISFGIVVQSDIEKFIGTKIPSVSLISIFLAFIVVILSVGVIWIWRRNRVVITNKHIVDVDQLGLFNRKVSTLTLQRIQDVSANVKGPLQTIFQYGTVIVQTAGERENFSFDYIKSPYKVEQYILDIHQKYGRDINARHEHSSPSANNTGGQANTPSDSSSAPPPPPPPPTFHSSDGL